MNARTALIGALLVVSPLIFLYIYRHDQHSEKNHHSVKDHHSRVDVVLDYLHYDSASVMGQIVRYKKSNKLNLSKKKPHFEYEFMLNNKKYNGLVYESELHRDNHQHLGVNDSIRILYSKSDPFLNIPHIIADDLHQANQ